MRVFAAVLLGMSLVASPLLARNAGETGKEDTPVAATSASAVPDKPAAVKPEASAIESEMQDLRSLVEEQRAELESQRAALKARATEDGSARGKARRDAFGIRGRLRWRLLRPLPRLLRRQSPPRRSSAAPLATPSTAAMAAMHSKRRKSQDHCISRSAPRNSIPSVSWI